MAFRVLDKKGLGFIQSSSFKHLMTNIGASYTFITICNFYIIHIMLLDSSSIFPGINIQYI